eukprot:CFRG8254T1
MKYSAGIVLSMSTAARAVLVSSGSNLNAAIGGAAPGEIIELAAGGDYFVNEPIIIDRKIEIVGPGARIIVPTLTSAAFAFGTSEAFTSTLDGITIATEGAGACDLAEPYALQANFSIDITAATVSNNNVNIVADVGVWHNERQLTDMIFADCKYSNDFPAKMSGGVYKLLGNCRSQMEFSVAFDKLGGATGCGTTIEDFATFTSYRAQVEGQWNEYVEKVDDEKNLRLPVTREGNAVTNLLIQIDTVRNVAATINAQYAEAEIEAAINLVDVGYWDGWNQSKVRLEIHLPAPYTVTNTRGELMVTNNEAILGQYKYELVALKIGCQEFSSPDVPAECPGITDDIAHVKFFIDTNNFCEIEEFDLEALFDLSISIKKDSTYVLDHPDSIFPLGDMSYWSILINTDASGIALYDAVVTYVERTTDGDCTSYANYMGDVSALGANEFTQVYDPTGQQINIAIPVTTQMACATADRTGNAITMNYTVLVDYDDGSNTRRRRNVNVSRRDAGELSLEKEAGVQYTEKDLATAAATGAGAAAGAAKANEEDNTLLIGAVIGVLLLLCCCCCCCAVAGVVVMRRRAEAKKKEESIMSQQSAMGFTNASNMSFAQPNQKV